VLFFGRFKKRRHKITGALHKAFGKVLTTRICLRFEQVVVRWYQPHPMLPQGEGENIKTSWSFSLEANDFEGGGEIITVSIPRMYEETCVSHKVDGAEANNRQGTQAVF
jgi:hypothetical protein